MQSQFIYFVSILQFYHSYFFKRPMRQFNTSPLG